ncbi:tRNA-binding protein [Maribacter polysiphoniae]|uniref:tRNA-binding protein n=1 Tax=Maribacter polysiphoniae TaxID=429344 RepID=A0A316E5Y6_9FLAO|nr:tRNA-binding protein [Maribacter polysiphoniae]MBD1259213.1 tRNA-binding protein [Maribacter polysiphoniae]PWK24769.1 tRNA-binding protein [Maribacter polysiphoniae]
MDDTISWSDFAKVDMRVGTIIEVRDFPEAHKPAYQLKLDFGEGIGVKKSSAQLTELYTKEELLGKQVIAVINFPDKQIANFMSECLILGAVAGKEVVLLKPDSSVPNGLKIA